MVTSDPVVADDYTAHATTYRSFVRGVQWVVGTIALILILMAYFLL